MAAKKYSAMAKMIAKRVQAGAYTIDEVADKYVDEVKEILGLK